MIGEADSVNSVSACHIGGPKGVSPGQKALLHGTTTQSHSGMTQEKEVRFGLPRSNLYPFVIPWTKGPEEGCKIDKYDFAINS